LKLSETSFGGLPTQTLFQRSDRFTNRSAYLHTKFAAVAKQAEEQLFLHAENRVKFLTFLRRNFETNNINQGMKKIYTMKKWMKIISIEQNYFLLIC
jgi:hypothetical protein